MAATPIEDRAIDAYGKGYTRGATIRAGGTVSPAPDPDPNDWIGAWEAIGIRDGLTGIPRNRFEGISVAVSPDERRVYDQGYDGANVAVRHDWYQQGQKDRAVGKPRRYVLEQIYGDAGPGQYVGVVPPPAPVGNGGVVVLPPPPYRNPPPYGNPPPVVTYPNQPYPPDWGPPYWSQWDRYPRRHRRRSGLVLRGPWGEIDLGMLAAQLGQPQTVRPGDLLNY